MKLRDKKVQVPLAIVLTLLLGWSSWSMMMKVKEKPWLKEPPELRKERLAALATELDTEGKAPKDRLAAARASLDAGRLDEAEEALRALQAAKEAPPPPTGTAPVLPGPVAVVQVAPTPPTAVSAVGVARPWRDPFKAGRPARPSVLQPPPAESGLVLSAVCTSGKEPAYAVLNGAVLKVGERLDGGAGWELTSVNEGGVVLVKDGVEYYLPIK